MIYHVSIKGDGRKAEPPRGTAGNAIAGNQQRFNVDPVVNNKSAKEAKYKQN